MTSVALHEIVFDEEIYPRTAWSQRTVDRYADAMHAGEMFPPIILESGTNRLLDGMHRTEAFRAVGRDLVPVDYQEIPDGVPAKLYAASLSSRHGDPLASEDKRQVARETAISNPDFSMVLIAKLLGTTRQTVSKYVGDIAERRREVRRVRSMLLTRSGLSNRKAAEVLGVDESVVRGDVKDDNPPHLSEDLLREAAADLPVDVEAIVETVLAELEVPAHPIPTLTPGPADTTTPPVDPGATPAPTVDNSTAATAAPLREPDPAEILRVLGEFAPYFGMTAAEIGRELAANVFHADLLSALEQLLDAGKVVVVGQTTNGARYWALTPKPVAASTASTGSGAEAVASPPSLGDATAEDLRDLVLAVLPIGEDDAVTFGELLSKLGDPEAEGRPVREALDALNDAGKAACTQGPAALIWWATGLGSDYRSDPAERIAEVAKVAPEYVKPVEPEQVEIVKAARGHAKTIVATLEQEVRAIVVAVDLGESGLVTEQMIADLRAAVDLLASRLEVSA